MKRTISTIALCAAMLLARTVNAEDRLMEITVHFQNGTSYKIGVGDHIMYDTPYRRYHAWIAEVSLKGPQKVRFADGSVLPMDTAIVANMVKNTAEYEKRHPNPGDQAAQDRAERGLE
jgi:hypothetical protein